jgi:hypothetical protein
MSTESSGTDEGTGDGDWVRTGVIVTVGDGTSVSVLNGMVVVVKVGTSVSIAVGMDVSVMAASGMGVSVTIKGGVPLVFKGMLQPSNARTNARAGNINLRFILFSSIQMRVPAVESVFPESSV